MKKRYLSSEKDTLGMLASTLFLNRCCLWSKRLKSHFSAQTSSYEHLTKVRKSLLQITSDTHTVFFPVVYSFCLSGVFLMNESPSQIIVNSPYYQMSFLKFGEKYVFIPAWVSSRAKQDLWEKLGFSNTSPPENVSGNLFWNGYWNIFKAHYQNILSKTPNHNYFW